MSARRGAQPTFALVLGVAAVALLLLPFVTTFDDLLTGAALRVGLDAHISGLVPAESRMVVAVLNLLGVGASAHGAYIHVEGLVSALFISWNCVGWQSALLLGLTMTTGLRGRHTPTAVLQVLLAGLLGTFLINIARVTLVCLLAARAGYLAATLFHDYGGTLMLIAWLFAFWSAAYRWVLSGGDREPA